MTRHAEPGRTPSHAALIGIVSAGVLGILQIGAQIAAGGVSALSFLLVVVAAAFGGFCIYFLLGRRWRRATAFGAMCLILLAVLTAVDTSVSQHGTPPAALSSSGPPASAATSPATPPSPTLPSSPPSSAPPPSASVAATERLRASAPAVHGALSITITSVTSDADRTVVTVRANNAKAGVTDRFYNFTLIDFPDERIHNRNGGDFPGSIAGGESFTATIEFAGEIPTQSTRITVHFGDTINSQEDFFDLAVTADLR